MEKDSALYQLMDTRMHSVMNGIVSGDGEYQAILRKSDIYSGELDRMDLSKEIRLLIDRYVSEQNAHSTCAIDPSMGCSLWRKNQDQPGFLLSSDSKTFSSAEFHLFSTNCPIDFTPHFHMT